MSIARVTELSATSETSFEDAINVAVALLSALVVLPPMMVWADSRGLLNSGAPERVSSDGTGPRVVAAPQPRATRPELISAAVLAGVLGVVTALLFASSSTEAGGVSESVFEPVEFPNEEN